MSVNSSNDAPRVTASSVSPEELALAALAFCGSQEGSLATMTRHLAWLPPDSLDLDMSDPEQCHFGDYQLVEKLGEGGMGVVYRAQQLGLDREVAIKLLTAGPWAAPDFVKRFRDEAQSAARMQHPNIVPIYEIGVHEELVFYSMRLVRGPSLGQLLSAHGPLDARQAAMNLRTLAEAVQYAHQLSVLHLDLKPDNVLIDERGWPHVADFGLARRLDHTLSAESNEISGTPSYMAPEQATAGKHLLTPATDIYGLGAIFYEMLTGIPPFRDASLLETLKQVREKMPRALRDILAGIPRDLEAICLKCLAKKADERYASARDLAEDLTRFLDRRPVQARPLSPPARLWHAARRDPWLATAMTAALVALIAGLIASTVQWRRAEGSASAARSTLWQARRDSARTAFESGDWLNGLPELAASVAEEERAGVDASFDRLRLGVALGNSPRLVDQMPFGDDGASFAFSPDGMLLAAGGAHLLATYETVTGAQRWRTNSHVDWVRFETDGQAVQAAAFSKDWTTLTRRFREIDGQELPPTSMFENPEYVAYSKDGRYALLGSSTQGFDPRRMQVWQTNPWLPVSAPRLLPAGYSGLSDDGSQLYLRHLARRVDVLDRTTLTARLKITAPAKSDFQNFAFSPDSRLLAAGYNNGRIELLDLASGKLHELPRSFTNRVDVAGFSDDSAWVAAGSRDGDIKIWETATGRSVVTPLRGITEVTDLTLDRHAHLLANNAGGFRLWSLPPVASEFAQPALLGPRLAINQRSETGTMDARHGWIATQSDGDTDTRLWRLPQSTLRHAHAAPLHVPDLDFDGSHLVAVDRSRVTVVDAWSERPSSPTMEHPQPVSFAALSADGATLVTISGRELFAWDWRTHKPRFDAIAFANSPQRMAINPGATSVLVVYTEYRNERFAEIAQVFGLADGKAVAPAVALPGPLRGVRFSVDGSRILYWRGNEIVVCDALTLMPAHEPFRLAGVANIVLDARLDATGSLFATVRDTEHEDQFALWRLDSAGNVLSKTIFPIPGVPLFVSAVTRDGARMATALGLGTYVLRQGEKPQRLPLATGILPGDEAAAFSPDGRLLAIAIKSGVQVFNAANDEPLAPPLRIALEMHDEIVQLAFAADGQSLLARTAFGRWLVWRVAPDLRPAEEIMRELDIVAHANGGATRSLDASTRTWLRSHDPGPPPAVDDVDVPDPNLSSPLRDPGTPAELLDLSRYYSSISSGDFRLDEMFDLHQMPSGVQRLLGVDFDIRGLVQFPNYTMVAMDFPQRVDSISVPEEVAALDLLVGGYFPAAAGEASAEVTLQYRDGGTLQLPLRYRSPTIGEDLPVEHPHIGEPVSERIAATAWLGAGVFTERWGEPPQRLYMEHLINPQPSRKLKSFSLAANRSLFLVAATVERPVAHSKP